MGERVCVELPLSPAGSTPGSSHSSETGSQEEEEADSNIPYFDQHNGLRLGMPRVIYCVIAVRC